MVIPDSNLTCGVVVSVEYNGTPHFCGVNAAFRYTGLVPLKTNENQTVALKLRGRMVLDECMDHSRLTFINMEPALRDQTATMRCLVQTRLTIRCTACQSVFRFEPLAPTVVKAPGNFCPNCGAKSSATTFDPQLDYWELIATQLDLADDVKLTQQIHSLWLRDRTATSKFIDYVTEIQRSLG